MFGAIGEKFTSKKDTSSAAADNSMSSISGAGAGAISVPWRRTGIKYTSNEFFLDIVEDVDCIVEANGNLVSAAVAGNIYANCKLSGMPDLTLNFVNPGLLDDVSLHPCVRVFRWEKSRIISFVPPDGRFKLMSYRVRGSGVIPPINIRPSIKFDMPASGTVNSGTSVTGKLDISVVPKHFPNPKNVVEELTVTIPLPKSTSGVMLTTTAGTFDFDQKQKVVVWNIGKWNPQIPQVGISGTVTLAPGIPAPESCSAVSAQFKIAMYTASGIRVDNLNVHESYSPYKGVRSITRGGQYFFRT